MKGRSIKIKCVIEFETNPSMLPDKVTKEAMYEELKTTMLQVASEVFGQIADRFVQSDRDYKQDTTVTIS